jgi:putative transposase
MMPDHVHLMLNPSGQGETVGQIVGELKRKQYFHVRDAHGVHVRFQKQFWDHVVGRSADPEEEFNAIVWYIRHNPVRAGLSATPEDYPFLL